MGSTHRPRVEWAEGINEVATKIRSRNHKYIPIVEKLIISRAHVWNLGMGIGMC